MYNPTIETHLDNLFADGARSRMNGMRGKIYSYNVPAGGYANKPPRKGHCTISGVSYSKRLDCNLYTIVDIETNETLVYNEFDIILKEEKNDEQ